MASLDSTVTIHQKGIPFGPYYATLLDVDIGNLAADEWITKAKTCLSNVVAAFCVHQGDTVGADTMVYNCATGTGGTAGSSMGALSIEGSGGPATVTLLIIGRP